MVTNIYKIRLEIWVAPSLRNLAAQKHQISAQFHTTLRLDCEYLLNATSHRQWENSVANYGHDHTGELNLVHFGPFFGQQTVKIEREF